MIELKSYDKSWPILFEKEKQAILVTVSDLLNIDHIGSTSVPGLAAKPTIDICISVDSLCNADHAIIEQLKKMGYEYLQHLEEMIPDRRYLQRLDPDNNHLFHIHIVEENSQLHLNYILFRDYLIAHPSKISEYAQLKTLLAKQFTQEREKYTEGKVVFISKLLQDASVWKSNQCMLKNNI